MLTTPFVSERFSLDKEFVSHLKQREVPWGFGEFSQVVYYRTYSRTKPDGSQEQWGDTIARVVEGVMSIRKDWYLKHDIRWDEQYWDNLARRLAVMFYDMKLLPPGRGLWAMGTEYIYERGGMCLYNCGAVDVTKDLGDAAAWAMNALMLGVGVGFSTHNANLHKGHKPKGEPYCYTIPDTREGWVESTRMLIDSYMEPHFQQQVVFDYSLVRKEGAPLKGFGGVSSGSAPLTKLHERLHNYLGAYSNGQPNSTRLVADVFNAIGACVVSGNIRRSAEIALGSLNDSTFLNLKNYDVNPDRAEIGWMSNNSVMLQHSEEFELLPMIAERIRDNGEPGIVNLINSQKYARYGKKKPDLATMVNPCSEVNLESKETCNLAEIFPSRCSGPKEIWEAMELGTFYASTVSLLPTQDEETNDVIARNRRIGVSISGIADWLEQTNLSRVTMILREGYEKHVEPVNSALAEEAGVPASVRLTTVKPSGTISLLAGVSPGMHWPVSRFAIRRMRISMGSPLVPSLIEAGIPYEEDTYSDNTYCFSFPLASGNGKTRAVSEVSIWEQASLVAMLQREWADNAVSNTLTFRKAEESQVERVLGAFAPVVKSISMLPDQSESDHAYVQLPYESISHEQYVSMLANSATVDWSKFSGADGMEEKFCDSDKCEIP